MSVHRTPPKLPRPEPAPRVSSPAIAELVKLLTLASEAADPQAARQQVLQEFHTVARETPLFEASSSAGHTIVTFLYWDAAAAEVLLFANRLTDERNIAHSLMDRVPGTPIWSLSYLMRDDWRASYAFVPLSRAQAGRLAATYREGELGSFARSAASERQAEGRGEMRDDAGQLRLRDLLDRGLPDPRNSVRCMNRVRKPMSVVSLPEALHDPWPADCIAVQHPEIYTGLAGILQRAEVPGNAELPGDAGLPGGAGVGELTGVDGIAGLAGQELWLYEPPELRANAAPRGDLPLLVVLDGDTWLTQQHLHRILERQILAGELPPLRALFVASGGRENRWQRLHAAAEFETVLVQKLLPWARTHWQLPASGPTLLTGQSLSGYVAITAALRHPRAFSHVIAQSASLWQTDPLAALSRHGSHHSFEAADSPQLHIQVGLQEWVLLEPHRELVRTLKSQGWDVTATEFNGGHDYVLWRAHLMQTLKQLLQ